MIWIIGSVAFLLRVWDLGHAGFWTDEISTLQCVSGSWDHLWVALSRSSELPYSNANTNPPFYFLLLWLWAQVFGLSETALRIPSALFGTLTVHLVGRIAKELKNDHAGFFAAGLLAVHPVHIIYSREARPYVLSMLMTAILVLISFHLVRHKKSLKKNALSVGFFALIVSALTMTQYNMAPLPILLCAWICFHNRRLAPTLLLSLLIPIGLGILWLPALADQLSDGKAYYATTGYRLFGEPGNLILAIRILIMMAGLAAAEFSMPFTLKYIPDAYPTLFVALAAVTFYALALHSLRVISRTRILWIFFAYASVLFIMDSVLLCLNARYLLFFLPFLLIAMACNLSRYPRKLSALVMTLLLMEWGVADWAILKPVWSKSVEKEAARAVESLPQQLPRYFVIIPKFDQDAVFHYLCQGQNRKARAIHSYQAPRFQKAQILALNIYPYPYPPFHHLYEIPSLSPQKIFRWGPLQKDSAGFGIVFQTERPRQAIAEIEQALKPTRLPFDPYPVWTLSDSPERGQSAGTSGRPDT